MHTFSILIMLSVKILISSIFTARSQMNILTSCNRQSTSTKVLGESKPIVHILLLCSWRPKGDSTTTVALPTVYHRTKHQAGDFNLLSANAGYIRRKAFVPPALMPDISGAGRPCHER